MPLTTQLKVEPGHLLATVTGVNEDLKGALACHVRLFKNMDEARAWIESP